MKGHTVSLAHSSGARTDSRAWHRHCVNLDAHLVLDGAELMAAKTKDFSARSFAFLIAAGDVKQTKARIGCQAVASILLGSRAVRIGGKLARVNRNEGQIEVGFLVPGMLHPAAYELLMRVAYARPALDCSDNGIVEKACAKFPDLARLCIDRFDERLLVHIEWATGHDKRCDAFFMALVQLRAHRDDIELAAQSTSFSDNVPTDVLIRKLRDPFWMMDLDDEAESLLNRVVQEVALAESTASL